LRPAALALVACLALPGLSWGHGFAGKRFFPTTLAIDDPFVSDELSFLGSFFTEPGEGDASPTGVTAVSGEFSKRITPHLGVSVGQEFRHLDPEEGGTEEGGTRDGFGNLELGLKHQFLTSEAHEAILSVGLSAELGKTGNRSAGAESISTLSPRLSFGKGFGDLPESLKYLRPMAITGVIGPDFPTKTRTVTTSVDPETGDVVRDVEKHPDTLSWGIALEYSLQYLQSFVKDIGLGAPFSRMVALVEVPVQVCLDRGCSGATTGTVNPGLTWIGKYTQFGIEVQIPINERTGHHVGGLALVHFFIDDLFPQSLGRPLFP
jgi:hypothetical protein